MDRASGSGVFARDPDALLDLIELETTEALMKQEENKAICQVCTEWLNHYDGLLEGLSQDDLCSSYQMLMYCKEKLKSLDENMPKDEARQYLKSLSADFMKIGHVPYKEKDKVFDEYKKLLDAASRSSGAKRPETL